MPLTDYFSIEAAYAVKTTQIVPTKDMSLTYPSFFPRVGGFPGFPVESRPLPPPAYKQGETIGFRVFLYEDGQAVSLVDNEVAVVVKTSQTAPGEVWRGTLTAGLTAVEDFTNAVLLELPYTFSAVMRAGTYFFDVVLSEKAEPGRIRVNAQGSFTLDYSVISPNPEIEEVPAYATSDQPKQSRTF